MRSLVRVFTIIACFTSLYCYSQIFPVNVALQLSPPYSGLVGDYTSAGSEKLKVILTLKDFAAGNVPVKIFFEIKGSNFFIKTKSYFTPEPIYLQSGVPTLLTGNGLGLYLDPVNVDYSGLTTAQVSGFAPLPEGYYSVCVKVQEYFSGQLIGEAPCAEGWFLRSDPPLLNLPLCNSGILPQNPQSILFSWSSMNSASPNSSGQTEYEFLLWEYGPDTTVSADQIAFNTIPVFSITTNNTFLNYGISEPALNLYSKYIWRVRAIDPSGRDHYKNGGLSEVCVFRNGSIRNVLGNQLQMTLSVNVLSHRAVQCNWNTHSAFTSYLLQVRKKGSSDWFDFVSSDGYEKISNLEALSNYECRVRGNSSDLTGEWSNIKEFKTPEAPIYSCNDQSTNYNVMPGDPLPAIRAVRGLVIQSGQFEIRAFDIAPNGAPGYFSGRGIVTLLGMKKFSVKWDNIYIDSEARHQQGTIEAITDGIEKWMHEWDVFTATENATYVDGVIDTAYISGNQVCYSLTGSSGVICSPTPSNANIMAIRDAEGKQYTVEFNPPPPKISGPSNFIIYSTDSLKADATHVVYFESSMQQNFGFDAKEHSAYAQEYETIKLGDGKNYFVPFKSIGLGATDEVLAKVQVENFNSAFLEFKSREGQVISFNSQGTDYVRLSGISYSMASIYAFYNGDPIGKLNIVPLKSQLRKVVLVPVNGANHPVTASDLNAVFRQANVEWSLTVAPAFNFPLGSDGLEEANANLLSKYSSEMRALKNAYMQYDTLYDREAYYLFVVSGFSNSDLNGYMVRGRAAGFIKPQTSIKFVCHELAHGAFGLEHTFPLVEKNSSLNLMDYSSGVKLTKEQWEIISINKSIFNWLDDEEDNAALVNQREDLLRFILDLKSAYEKNTVLNISNFTSIMAVGQTFIGGVEYPYIRTVILPYVVTLGVVNVNNTSVSTSTFTSEYPQQGSPKPCIDIGGKIKIFVPADKIENLKNYIMENTVPGNLIVFVNGYRPTASMDGSSFSSLNFAEYEDSDNKVNYLDLKGCWSGIDAQFVNRIGTKNVVYADGHHSVKTSNHCSVSSFMKAMIKAMFSKSYCENEGKFEKLCTEPEKRFNAVYCHTVSNVVGFSVRRSNGMIAGLDLVNKINNGEIPFNKETGKIDIVAHSMGYAYSTGLVEVLRQAGFGKNFGIYYIIAPENACAGGVPWALFEAAWQYGSDLHQPDQDPIFLQDGVAPQCGCTNLKDNSIKKNAYTGNIVPTGRIFIPKNFDPKDFGNSHYLVNYHWIFGILPTVDGYIRSRNMQ